MLAMCERVAENQCRKNILEVNTVKAKPILARVNAILALSDEPTPTRCELQKLAANLAGYVRQEVAASRGVGDAAKTIQRMLNDMKKSDAGRTALHYAWIDEEGRQCACDGFRAYRLNEPLPLEERPDIAGDGIDLDKIIPDIAAGSFDALPLPSIAELMVPIINDGGSRQLLLHDEMV